MIHLFEQGSEEWLSYKKNRFSASQAQAIYAHGKGLLTLIENMCNPNHVNIDNEAMARGRELESTAALLFEINEGISLNHVGFIDYTDFSGCSPDGVIYENEVIVSGLEIKCRDFAKHDAYLNGKMDAKTNLQMQFCMMVCDCEEWHFVAYNPDHFIPYYHRVIERNEEIINEIRYGLEIGEKLLIDKLLTF
jgi:hypothetical protein